MAKDDGIFDDYTSDVKKATQATKEGSEALEKLRRAQETPVDAKNPDLDHIEKFPGLVDKATAAQKSWTEEIKDSVKQLAEQAREIGSLRSQFKDVTGALGGFANKLKTTASITHQYTLAMREFTQGSEAYSASLNLSTAAVAKHGSEAQKYMTAIQKSYNSAYDVAAKYGVQVEEIRKVSEDLQKTFGTQLGVMGDQGKALDRLRNQTVAYSRITGVSAAEATQELNERLRATGMTLDQVRQEQLLVAKSIDDYKNKLEAMGKEAKKTGNITSKDFLDVLKQVRAEFRQGAFDAATFARSMTTIAIAGKKAGLTTEEAKQTALGFGRMLKQAGQFSSFFGAKSAMVMQDMMKNMDQIQDEQLKKRVSFIQKQNYAPVQKLDMIAAAMQGTSEGQAILTKTMRTHMPKELFLEQAKSMGQMNAYQAAVLTEQVYSRKLEEDALAMARKSPEERAKEAEKFASPMEKLAAQGARAEKARHKYAKKMFEWQNKITQFVEKYWYMMAAIQAGASLLGRGGGLGGVLGKAGGGAGMLGKAGGAVSLAFLAYAGYKGGQSVYESWKKGKKGEALVKASALPFTGGYKMGEEWEKQIGEGMYRSGASGPLSASTRAMMAHSKDKSLTSVLSMKLMDLSGNKEWQQMRKDVINVDWKTLALAKKKYKAIDADIKRLEEKKRLDGFLNDADEATLKLRKAEAKQLEGRVKGIKRLVKAESDEVVTARMRKDQMSDLIEGMGKVDFGNLGTKKGVRGELQKVIKSSGRLYAYKGSEKAFKKLMDDPLLGAQLRAMAKSANMTPEELLKMYTEESTAMGKGKGAPTGVEGAMAGSKQGQAALMQYIQEMKKKGMPVEVTRAMARKFGVSEEAFKDLSSVTAKEFRISAGDSKGSETTIENADGGRTRVITTTQKMYITQDGSDRQKTAANNELQVQRMKNNKDSKG